MKAAPAQQRRLLDLQETDTRLDQLAYAVRTLRQHKELEQVSARLAATDVELVNARTHLSDTRREQARAEADVELVRERAARNRARLDAGIGTAKELQGLQSEQQSLARRQGDLEEIELEVMERVETLEHRVDQLASTREEIAAEQTAIEREKAAALDTFAGEAAEVERRRAAILPELAADLVALYGKVRASTGGVGAAALRQRRCGGCELELNRLELDRIRTAPADDVVRCQECGRILVRTHESGI